MRVRVVHRFFHRFSLSNNLSIVFASRNESLDSPFLEKREGNQIFPPPLLNRTINGKI